MAGTGDLLDRNHFNCCICLNVLENPATLPCGHNYCMACIQEFWNKDENSECICPQCRRVFIPRPVLGRNNMLDEVVNKFRGGKFKDGPSYPLLCCIWRRCKLLYKPSLLPSRISR
uniref:RING-type domain-containing protein n=1 Tax=Scleropages formosus TaxID=113540 RepID=A0A8C9QXK1_SCLFO